MSQPEAWIMDTHWLPKPSPLSLFPHLDPTGQAIYVKALERHIQRTDHVLNLLAKEEIDTNTAQASFRLLTQQLQQTRHDLLLGSPSLN